MMKLITLPAVFAMAFLVASVAQPDTAQAQLVPTYFPAPVEVVPARNRPFSCFKQNRQMLAVQVGYPAYYAPQVPVIPMSAVPVPTMSAYYVPTVPVISEAVVPAYSSSRVRRARYYSVPTLPAAIYPVYGY